MNLLCLSNIDGWIHWRHRDGLPRVLVYGERGLAALPPNWEAGSAIPERAQLFVSDGFDKLRVEISRALRLKICGGVNGTVKCEP